MKSTMPSEFKIPPEFITELEKVCVAMNALARSSSRYRICEEQGAIIFGYAARFWLLDEKDGGCWRVNPCDENGRILNIPGRPADIVTNLHPEDACWRIAAFALLTAHKWELPEQLRDLDFLTVPPPPAP